jgi:nucleosome assembly protein 1-like 1
MGGEKETFDMSDLNASLPAAAAGNLRSADTVSHPLALEFAPNRSALSCGLHVALSAEDRAGLVNALKVRRFRIWVIGLCNFLACILFMCCLIRLQDKLQSLAGQHADVLESLSPNVRKRVEFLREIQVDQIVPFFAFRFCTNLI